MKKRILSALLTLITAFTLTACGGSDENAPKKVGRQVVRCDWDDCDAEATDTQNNHNLCDNHIIRCDHCDKKAETTQKITTYGAVDVSEETHLTVCYEHLVGCYSCDMPAIGWQVIRETSDKQSIHTNKGFLATYYFNPYFVCNDCIHRCGDSGGCRSVAIGYATVNTSQKVCSSHDYGGKIGEILADELKNQAEKALRNAIGSVFSFGSGGGGGGGGGSAPKCTQNDMFTFSKCTTLTYICTRCGGCSKHCIHNSAIYSYFS